MQIFPFNLSAGKICGNLETLKKIAEGYFCLDDLKIKTWTCNPFLGDIDSKSMMQNLPKMTLLPSASNLLFIAWSVTMAGLCKQSPWGVQPV